MTDWLLDWFNKVEQPNSHYKTRRWIPRLILIYVASTAVRKLWRRRGVSREHLWALLQHIKELDEL